MQVQPPQVGDRFGRYHIDALLGMGGMGVVYLATDSELGRQVALKVVAVSLVHDDHYLARFHREADVLTRLDSPHIVRIFDHGEERGCAYLATQHVAGGDLARLTAQRGALPTGLAISLCAQVADGLADAHRSGVIHRDIKPSNVLIHDPDATQLHAYICDFGIAQTQDMELTGTRGVTGSWPYLAPERARGERGTAASDVYSLGCLLWFCLTGRPPYAGTDVETALGHAHGPVPRLAGDSPAIRQLNAVLTRSMAKEPRERYTTAEEMRDALRGAAAAAGVDRQMLAAPPAPAHPPRRWRALTIGLAALVVLLAVGVGAVVVARSSDDPAPDDDPTTGPLAASGEVTADYDGDGLGDMVATYDVDFSSYEAQQPPRTVGIFSSDGEGFGEPSEAAGLGEEARDLLRADLDDDPQDDAYVVETTTRGGFRLIPTDGGDPIAVPGVEDFALAPVSGDFDGDGYDDLVVVGVDDQDTATFSYFAGFGDAVFSEPERWATVQGWRLGNDQATSGDFDGDGRDDLTVVRRGEPTAESGKLLDSTVQLCSSTGTAFQATGEPRSIGDQGSAVVHAGDVDGNGQDELVTVESFYLLDSEIRVVGFDGGSFDPPRAWAQVVSDSSFAAAELGDTSIGDFDGDGRDDLAVFYATGNDETSLHVYRSTGEAFADLEVWGRFELADAINAHATLANTEQTTLY